MTTPPRLPPIPAASKPPTRPCLPWRSELRVAIRDGYQCRVCEASLIADGDRRLVIIAPALGHHLENIALVCERCARAHDDHQQPIEPAFERVERLT
jgi:hypothetical protein